MPKNILILALAGAVWLCGSIAGASISTDDDLRGRITAHLSNKGDVIEIVLLNRRKTCRSMLMTSDPNSEVYSYGATLRASGKADVKPYLICVEIAPDDTFNIEYFPDSEPRPSF